MMQAEQNHIKIILDSVSKNFPEFLRAKDLIACGLFKSPCDVSLSVSRGLAPPSIRVSKRKRVFPRSTLCEWLENLATKDLKGNAADEHAT